MSVRSQVPVPPPLRLSRLFVAVALTAALAGGCKSENENEGPVDERPMPALVGISVPNTPLSLKIPDGWRILVESDNPLPAPPDGPRKKIDLTGRLMMTVREKVPSRNGLAAPRVEVFHDPWLPVGTTAADYLRAHRRDNKRAVPDIRHVEAERSRRTGRPAYLVRDEWVLHLNGAGTVSDKDVTVSQESLLLVDTVDGTLHGYAVVATLLAEDRPKLERALYEILGSIRFAE